MTHTRAALTLTLLLAACGATGSDAPAGDSPLRAKVEQYATFRLTTDVSALDDDERAMLPLFIEAARQMDAIFWREAWGDRQALLDRLDDPWARRYAEINYGPWDRLDGDAPFVQGIGPKPKGANFYPSDLTAEELDAWCAAHPDAAGAVRDPYTIVRRGADGDLVAEPYHRAFAREVRLAAEKIEQASELARDPGLKRYLALRAEALRTDDYRASDMAWLDMKSNGVDVVIGPIENYEDKLAGKKNAHECYVLVKDKEWSRRLERYAALLPGLQRALPVPEAYKRETPGRDSDLGAYDVVYYAGDCNAGSKTIAINLPNDEVVQLEKGTRRLQLKNAMRAKFDSVLVPLAEVLIARDQRRHVTFEAFFGNTMFHEVAHGLGIKNTVDGSGTVRDSLKDLGGALEEGKADILGLFMITELFASGDLSDGELMDYYVTFLASIFRSVRFGASSAHGRANMIRFRFFEEMGAFERDGRAGTYRVDFERMQAAMRALSAKILTLQGDGDYAGTEALFERYGAVSPGLQADLDRLTARGIPVDIVFEQGLSVLGL